MYLTCDSVRQIHSAYLKFLCRFNTAGSCISVFGAVTPAWFIKLIEHIPIEIKYSEECRLSCVLDEMIFRIDLPSSHGAWTFKDIKDSFRSALQLICISCKHSWRLRSLKLMLLNRLCYYCLRESLDKFWKELEQKCPCRNTHHVQVTDFCLHISLHACKLNLHIHYMYCMYIMVHTKACMFGLRSVPVSSGHISGICVVQDLWNVRVFLRMKINYCIYYYAQRYTL